MTAWDFLVNGAGQVAASVLAVIVWSYFLARSQGRMRVLAAIVWSITIVYAIQSLTYLEALDREAARTIAFTLRVSMIAAGIACVIHFRDRSETET